MVKDREEQTGFENIKETSSEWLSGDFSNRDARARQEASKERLKKHQEEQERQKDQDLQSQEVKKRREEIRDQRASEVKSQAEQESKTDTFTRKPKWWELTNMIDLLGIVDKIFTVLSIGKSASDLNEDASEKKSQSSQSNREEIAQQRLDEMKASREQTAEQVDRDEDRNHAQQKCWDTEWVTAKIQSIKRQVLRTLRGLNNFLNKSQQNVNKRRV